MQQSGALPRCDLSAQHAGLRLRSIRRLRRHPCSQERLHALQASSGASKPAAKQGQGKRSKHTSDAQPDDLIVGGPTVPRAQVGELEGLCTLLGLHLATLEGSQQPLVRLCDSAGAPVPCSVRLLDNAALAGLSPCAAQSCS